MALTTPNIGTAMSEDRDRIDFNALRATRRQRLFAELDRLGVDACLFGREANVRYASGARRLWTASSRPFGPTAIAVRSTERVHLMTFSASEEGAPSEVPLDELFATSFNVAKILEVLAAIPGLAGAKRIGVDGFTLFMGSVLPSVLPRADFVGIEPDLRALRAQKLPAEIAVIETAIAIAEAALYAAAAHVGPGVREKALQAAYLDRMCTLGTSQFGQQGTFTAIAPHGGLRWITGSGDVPAGAMVALAGSAMWAGYEGTLARTWWSGPASPPPGARTIAERARRAIDAMAAACRPGATGAELVRAHERVAPVPPMTVAYAVGLGHEGILAGSSLGVEFDHQQVIAPDMVVALRTFVPGPEGGCLLEDMFHAGADATTRLTSLGDGPLH